MFVHGYSSLSTQSLDCGYPKESKNLKSTNRILVANLPLQTGATQQMPFLKSKKLIASVSAVTLSLSALSGFALPAQSAAETKSITLSGFAANSSTLSGAMKSKLARFMSKNKGYGFVTCVGFADRPGSAIANSSLGKKRASAGCAEAVKANRNLEISGTRGKWDSSRSGSDVRRVKITLSKSSTATLTTTFKYRGGTKALVSIKSGIGETITLPSSTKEGYQFVGWFTKRKGGVQVGIGQGFYNPTKSRTLFARWTPGTVVNSTVACTEAPNVIADWQAAIAEIEIGEQDFVLQTLSETDGGFIGAPNDLDAITEITVPAAGIDGLPLGILLIDVLLDGFDPEETEESNQTLSLIGSCFEFKVSKNGSTVYSISGQDYANTLSLIYFENINDVQFDQASYERFFKSAFLAATGFSGTVNDEYDLSIIWGSSSIDLSATYVGSGTDETADDPTVTVVTANMQAGDFVYVCTGMPIWNPAQASTSCISSTSGVSTISTNGTYDYTWTITSFETDGRIYTYPVRDGALMNTAELDITPSLQCDNINAYFTGCYIDGDFAEFDPNPTITYTFPNLPN
jgi:uncharacterized repeat protein (TIGR02543 family)